EVVGRRRIGRPSGRSAKALAGSCLRLTLPAKRGNVFTLAIQALRVQDSFASVLARLLPRPGTGRQVSLDAIRALAAALVLVTHLVRNQLLLPGGRWHLLDGAQSVVG